MQITMRSLLDSALRTLTTLNAAKLSRPDVGSSRKTQRGWPTSSTAMAVRFFSPPEMPLIMMFPTSVSAHFSSPSCESMSSVSCTRSAAVDALPRRSAALKRIASRGVCVANRASSCITYATLLRCAEPSGLTTAPLTRTVPATVRCLPLLRIRPARMLSLRNMPRRAVRQRLVVTALGRTQKAAQSVRHAS